MKVDHVLILAAGKGTRMGEIGKNIPKVIWPIFKKSILELEVEFAKHLAPEANIFINLYNYKDKILKHIRSKNEHFSTVKTIEENEVLDIGGAIHNVAKTLNYKGNLLILNSDQFLFCEKSMIDNALLKLKDYDSLLFSYTVNSNDGYNALKIEDDRFLGVVKNSELKRNSEIVTYTGMSLINLEKLTPVDGESKFFNSIANPDSNKITTEKMEDFEYWDFGTLKRYHESIWNIKAKRDSKFYQFLKKSNALNAEVENSFDTNIEYLKCEEIEVGLSEIRFRDLTEKI